MYPIEYVILNLKVYTHLHKIKKETIVTHFAFLYKFYFYLRQYILYTPF